MNSIYDHGAFCPVVFDVLVASSSPVEGRGRDKDITHVIVAQQLKAILQTSQQLKNKLAQKTSVLDTQVAAAANHITDIQVTTMVTQVYDDQATTKAKPIKK